MVNGHTLIPVHILQRRLSSTISCSASLPSAFRDLHSPPARRQAGFAPAYPLQHSFYPSYLYLVTHP